MVTVILNFRFTISINFHNALHGYQESCSTGTASLEAKMIHQLTEMREGVLYNIFQDLNKVYDALDMDICLDILEGYGVGPRACRVLHAY